MKQPNKKVPNFQETINNTTITTTTTNNNNNDNKMTFIHSFNSQSVVSSFRW